MTRKITRLAACLAILGIALSGNTGLEAQSMAFSLNEAIDYGLEHSKNYKLQYLNIADADGELLEYKSIGIPKLEANGNYNYYIDLPTQIFPDIFSPAIYGILIQEGLIEEQPVPMGESEEVKFGTDHNLIGSLDLETMLFDFGWIQGLKAQKLYRELVLKNTEQTAFELRAAITKAYYATLIAERNYELLDNNVRNLTELLKETQTIYNEGFAEKLDVDRLTLSLENLKTERQNVGRSIEITKNLLKFQMGYPLKQEIELTENFDVLTVNIQVEKTGLRDINFSDRPSYRSLLLTEELNSINLKVIKAGYLPTFRGFASYSQSLQRNDLFESEESPWFPVTIVGVSMNLPIFDGLEKKAKLDRAKISLERARVRKEMFEESMTLEVRNARIQLDNARETVAARQRAFDLAEEIYQTAQIKYREGVGSSVEMSQAEADYYEAQNNYINALYELLIAKTDLDIALGKI